MMKIRQNSTKCFSTQIQMLNEELLVLVDKKDNIIGQATKRACHELKDASMPATSLPLHRAFSLFIIDPQRKSLLLQQRSMNKVTFPGIWANSICSHPRPMETLRDAVTRTLQRELGLNSVREIYPFGSMIYAAKSVDPKWGEHEYDHLFVTYSSSIKEINYNRDEVEAVRWVDMGELKSIVNSDTSKYAPWFRAIVSKYSHWDRLAIQPKEEATLSPLMHLDLGNIS